MKFPSFETKLFTALSLRTKETTLKKEPALPMEINSLKESLSAISAELDDKTFTVVEGIAALIIGSTKQASNYEARFKCVVKDYSDLLEFTQRMEDIYAQKKNTLHAYFKQPPVQVGLQEKALEDIERKIRLFSDVFGKEMVMNIWQTVRKSSLNNLPLPHQHTTINYYN